MEFPDDSKVDDILNEDVSLCDYINESTLFILDHNHGNFLDDPRRLYFIEVTVFTVTETLDLTLVVRNFGEI